MRWGHRDTYDGVYLFHDGAFGCLNGSTTANQPNLPFKVRARWLCDIDFAASGGLHVLDRLATWGKSSLNRKAKTAEGILPTFPDYHSYGLGRDGDGIAGVVLISTKTPALSAATIMGTIRATLRGEVLGIALDNLHDKVFGYGRRLWGAYQVHRT